MFWSGLKFRIQKPLRLLLVLSVFFLAGRSTGEARTITLAWYPSPGPDIAGYKVLCGLKSQVYISVTDVGNVTKAAITLPEGGNEFFLSVIAYNIDGLASAPSEELVYNPPLTPRVQLAPVGQGEMKLSWDAFQGHGYRVLRKQNLSDDTWQPASKVMIAASSLMQWVTAMNRAAPSEFFKLEVFPNANVPPRLEMAMQNSQDIKFSWASIPGMAYRVLHKPTLDTSQWTPISGLLTAETTLVEWMTQVIPGAPSGFFVLEVFANPEAEPTTQIAFAGNNRIKLAWIAVPTKLYQVFSRTDLSTGDWEPCSGVLTAESLAMEWMVDINPESPSGFFMVRQVTGI
jgi:hypothetical protein